jgi:FAD/FMN-containing dehydrogenase
MLEAEVVTADGELVVANACQHPDLFWALRGGGGGTFGVVTKLTLMTHPLPSRFGSLRGAIKARTDAAFRQLLARFVTFYRDQLSNEHWGEQVAVTGDNALQLSLAFEGMTSAEAEAVWRPFRAWIDERPDGFTSQISAVDLPADRMWSFAFFHQYAGDAIVADPRPGEPAGQFWWAGDAEQVSIYLYAYHSRWIPLDRFEGAEAEKLATALFEASRRWTVGLHFNKGQAGASADAIRRGHETSMNPAVFRAAGLAIVASGGDGLPGVSGHAPDQAAAEAARARMDAAAQILRDATPGAGSYVNETDYFEPDWQHTLWGDNYDKLLAIKRKYDPQGLFTCHHCVGSEAAAPPPR